MRENCGCLFKEGKLFSGTVRDNIDYQGNLSDELILKALHYLRLDDYLDNDSENHNMTQSKRVTQHKESVSLSEPGSIRKISGSTRKKSSAQESFEIFLKNYDKMDEQEMEELKEYLDYIVIANGDNILENQRKIILICRILLQQPDILYFEEASLNIVSPENSEDTFYFDCLFEFLPDSTIIAILDTFQYFNRFDKLYWLDKGTIKDQGTPKEILEQTEGVISTVIKQTDRNLYNSMLSQYGISDKFAGNVSLERLEYEKKKIIENADPTILEVIKRVFEDLKAGSQHCMFDFIEIKGCASKIFEELGVTAIDETDIQGSFMFSGGSDDGEMSLDNIIEILVPLMDNTF